MARPVQRKANKDYPNEGIKKGETYWYVKLKLQRGGIVKRSKTPFKQSQLTTSDFLGQLYDWQDEKAALDDMENAQALADRIRELGEEQQAKFDNMPEGLKQGDTGQMIEARATACETAAGEIEEIISEWETAKEEHDSAVAEVEDARARLDAANEGDDEDAKIEAAEAIDSMDDIEELDESDFIDRVQSVEVES